MTVARDEQRTGAPGRFRPYPEYRDSGVEWLGEIPAGWQVRRLKSVASIRLSGVDKKTVDGEEPVRLCNYVDVYYNDSITSALDLMEATASPAEIEDFTLRADDVLVTKDSETWEDIGVPAHVGSDLPGVLCGYHLAQIRPFVESVNGRYLHWSFGARGVNDQLRVSANGITRYGIGKQGLGDALFLVPPLPEQRAIAAFLDRETVRIDALVAKKERLVELLEEKRAALITHAVTKGLDPDAPMRDSGVKWLGDVPAGWELKRLWHLGPPHRQIIYGIVLPGPNVSEGVPIIRGGDVSHEPLTLDLLNRTTPEIDAAHARSRLRTSDLVYAIRGSIGDVAMVPDDLDGANLTQDAARVAHTGETHAEWLLFALKSSALFAQLEAGALGATIKGINIRDLRRAQLPFPPLSEQHAIAAFLDGETVRIDALVAKVQTGIERLREFRTALISAAVTGKIDVREEAA